MRAMPASIRVATPADAPGVQAIYAPIVRDTAISFEYDPPSIDEMRRRIQTTLERYPWLVCDDDGFVAGYAYAGPHSARIAYQWSSDVSVYNAESHRRRGVGRALYTALFDILEVQGFRQLGAGITQPNAASVGLHESLGFVKLADHPDIGYKLGRWHAVGVWQRSLGDGSATPPRGPVWFPEVASAAVEQALRSGTAVLVL